ncbi:hypothetical protein NP493_29g02072 [Ridgeia piscesae]|uniref:Uncharacterized protein n=1 Tax=Ridgeia piscesae TaxID=27915 RepID=A0AAD9PCU1_RIDPI|nr:hypothetical protein NP493_29g02072 [Ridgeia piscesae]
MRCPVHRRFFLMRRSSIDMAALSVRVCPCLSLCPSRLSS